MLSINEIGVGQVFNCMATKLPLMKTKNGKKLSIGCMYCNQELFYNVIDSNNSKHAFCENCKTKSLSLVELDKTRSNIVRHYAELFCIRIMLNCKWSKENLNDAINKVWFKSYFSDKDTHWFISEIEWKIEGFSARNLSKFIKHDQLIKAMADHIISLNLGDYTVKSLVYNDDLTFGHIFSLEHFADKTLYFNAFYNEDNNIEVHKIHA